MRSARARGCPSPRSRSAPVAKLTPVAVERLEALGVLGGVDEAAAHAELRELKAALDAVEELQTWVEAELASAV